MGDSTGTTKRPQRETGSLGWLSESAVQPKKQRLIEGVPSRPCVRSSPLRAEPWSFTLPLVVRLARWRSRLSCRMKPSHDAPCSAATAGVGAGGLLELRAQVYRTQEHARMVREGDAERPVRRKVPRACTHPCTPPALILQQYSDISIRMLRNWPETAYPRDLL